MTKKYKIKNGIYDIIENVVVEVETTVENITLNYISETDIINTINMLNDRKNQFIAQIDNEISYNENLLKEIKKLDRQSCLGNS
jgi:hypothetical protein